MIEAVFRLPYKRTYKGGKIIVDAKALPGIVEDYWPALMAWKDFKTFGLPYAGGYMEQPALWVAIMRVLENESAAWQEEQHKSGGIGRTKNSR